MTTPTLSYALVQRFMCEAGFNVPDPEIEPAFPHSRMMKLAHRLVSHGVDCARAALNQPDPVGPTDEEIKRWHSRCADLTTIGAEEHYWAFDVQDDTVLAIVHAALRHWGNRSEDNYHLTESEE